jgi:hypothetical protein
VTFNKTTAAQITLTNVVITESGNTIQNQTPSSATLGAGLGTKTSTFYFNRQSNGANGTFTITYDAPGFTGLTYTTPGAIPATTACTTACP